MMTFVCLVIFNEWYFNLQVYKPTPGASAGKWWACPMLLAKIGHYAAVPIGIVYLIVRVNA